MRNGKQQREQRRENFRQMELDAASRALSEAGHGQRQDLSLATRIEVVLHNLGIKQRQAEMKLSLRELEINMARTALLGALGQEDDGQVKLDDLLQALIISRNLAKQSEEEARKLLNAEIFRCVGLEQELGASHSLAHDRGTTIRTLERRLAANYQDESLAVKELEKRLAVAERANESLAEELDAERCAALGMKERLAQLLREQERSVNDNPAELHLAQGESGGTFIDNSDYPGSAVEVTPAPEEQNDVGV